MTAQEQKDIDADAADVGTGPFESAADASGACGRGTRLGSMICGGPLSMTALHGRHRCICLGTLEAGLLHDRCQPISLPFGPRMR